MANRPAFRMNAVTAILSLFMTILLLFTVVEWMNRKFVVKSSQIERRTQREIEHALSAIPVGHKRILLVGNSLLLFAIDDSVVRLRMPDPWSMQRVAIEQTYFLDWSYGLAGLYDRGERSTIEAIMLDPGQLVGDLTRGDYTAFRLARRRDVIALGEEAHLHPTDISRLVLSSWSSFYGFRGESRKVLLAKLIPGMSGLASMLAAPARSNTDTADTAIFEHAAMLRLERLRDESLRRASFAILIVPPMLDGENAIRALARAGSEVGVPVLVAFQPGSYRSEEFSDGFHLNERGRARFTNELGVVLDSLLRSDFTKR